MEPTEGHVFYDGRDFGNMTVKERKKYPYGNRYVVSGNALFDSLTVEENVRFPLDMFTDKSKEEKTQRVNEVLSRVHFENANHKFPSEVSGGMQEKSGYCKSHCFKSKYLFCDEPNSGLDPKTAIVIDELIREITQEYNITTLVNTHDMNSVVGIGDKILFLHKGK